MKMRCAWFGLWWPFLILAACGNSTAPADPSDICEVMYGNNCNRGCACPDDYECLAFGLSATNENICMKPCMTQADCPANERCVAVELIGEGSQRIVEGQCWPECDDARTCPEWGACHVLPDYPEQQEAVDICDWRS